MKKLIKSSLYFFSCVLLLNIMSCKKNDEKEKNQKCKSSMTITVLDEVGNCYSTNEYFYIQNWNEFSGELKTGKSYEVTYKEVPCNEIDNCMGDKSGIKDGGCFPSKKCIKICSLKEIKTECNLKAQMTSIDDYGNCSIDNKEYYIQNWIDYIDILKSGFSYNISYEIVDCNELINYSKCQNGTKKDGCIKVCELSLIKNSCNNSAFIYTTDLYGNCLINGAPYYIQNWNNLASQLIANHYYNITYEIVDCYEQDYYMKNDPNGIRKGGCIPEKTCIFICTLNPLENHDIDCYGTINNFEPQNCINTGISNAKLTGDKLDVICLNRGHNNYVLACDFGNYVMGMGPKDIIPVKVMTNVEAPPFEDINSAENLCFNLRDIKNWIVTNNAKPAPEIVNLRITYSDGTSEEIPWKINY